GGTDAAVREAGGGGIVKWLQSRKSNIRRIGSVCSGSLVLAATGLLDGRRATTHWDFCDEFFIRHPQVKLEPDAIFIADPPFYTSAGVTAGIDLALSLVESDHGAELGLRVARNLVIFMRRAGGQTQFSPALRLQQHAARRLSLLIADISADPTKKFRLP